MAAQEHDVYAEVPREAFQLLGPTSRQQLMATPHQIWLQKGYEAYQPNEAQMAALAGAAVEGLEFWLFIGTWCSDTRQQLPALLKVLDGAGVTEDNLHWVAVDEAKQDPDGLHAKWQITLAPTLIVLKGGQEAGRIQEAPAGTWEEHLVRVLSGTGR